MAWTCAAALLSATLRFFSVRSPLPWFPRGPGPCCEMHGLPVGDREALLWKVTTWSDAGLTHPLARAHVTSWSKEGRRIKSICSVQRTACSHVQGNKMRTLRKIASLNIMLFSPILQPITIIIIAVIIITTTVLFAEILIYGSCHRRESNVVTFTTTSNNTINIILFCFVSLSLLFILLYSLSSEFFFFASNTT